MPVKLKSEPSKQDGTKPAGFTASRAFSFSATEGPHMRDLDPLFGITKLARNGGGSGV